MQSKTRAWGTEDKSWGLEAKCGSVSTHFLPSSVTWGGQLRSSYTRSPLSRRRITSARFKEKGHRRIQNTVWNLGRAQHALLWVFAHRSGATQLQSLLEVLNQSSLALKCNFFCSFSFTFLINPVLLMVVPTVSWCLRAHLSLSPVSVHLLESEAQLSPLRTNPTDLVVLVSSKGRGSMSYFCIIRS